MISQRRPLLMAGASLLTAATMITATPVIGAGGDPTIALRSATSSYEMLSIQSSLSSALLPVIEKFLANHEKGVLAVAAKVPTFDFRGVTVGHAVLADAYYYGFKGSATGVPGVIRYVENQLGLPGFLAGSTAAANVATPHPLEALILKLTATIPKFKVGPVQIGGSLLADAYFNGYNGSASGVPGIIAYVKSQVGLPKSGASAAAAVASVPKAAAASVTISVPTHKKASASSASKHAAAATAVGHKNGHKK